MHGSSAKEVDKYQLRGAGYQLPGKQCANSFGSRISGLETWKLEPGNQFRLFQFQVVREYRATWNFCAQSGKYTVMLTP